jgi:hypothetical protein
MGILAVVATLTKNDSGHTTQKLENFWLKYLVWWLIGFLQVDNLECERCGVYPSVFVQEVLKISRYLKIKARGCPSHTERRKEPAG